MQTKGKQSRKVMRTKVAPGIWKRTGAGGKPRYEISVQGLGRHAAPAGSLRAGKRAAETLLRGSSPGGASGERVAPRPRLTFD